MSKAYYNEYDKFAAAWLRELIKAGVIAPGDVDERSIEDVLPSDLAGYTQCHFFAGIGVWSYALRQAGFSDDRQVWTGSCPCQPFSTAGKRKGTADERHLWPAFFHLIEQCEPSVIFGEQVEAAVRQGWLDLVQTDLEGSGYTVGAVGAPAAGFGAPHGRHRLYFVAYASSGASERNAESISGKRKEISKENRTQYGNLPVGHCDGSAVSAVANTCGSGQQRESNERCTQLLRTVGSTSECREQLSNRGAETLPRAEGDLANSVISVRQSGSSRTVQRKAERPSEVNGFWRNADWLWCRDEKYRAVEPGTFPLAHGATARVGRLRGFGNAIVAPQAEAFIRAYLEATNNVTPAQVASQIPTSIAPQTTAESRA